MTHTPDNSRPFNEDEFAREPWRSAWRSCAERADLVTPALDDEIRSATRAHFARPRVERHRGRRLIPAFAAAAILAIGSFLTWIGLRSRHAVSPPPATVVFEAADFDRSGRVDLLDAFGLAKAIELGASADTGASFAAADVNRDGRVDDRDVDHIAQQAVALPEGVG